ncbi:MAG TPA: NfeD family protein [Planctomycetaceae bacterium]|nr:NfeD family protein [Planctomycetaceae bacterium]
MHGRLKPNWKWLNRLLMAVIAGLLWLPPSRAQEAVDPPRPADGAEADPIGRFVTISGAADSSDYRAVTTIGTALQNRALQEHRKAVLVVEITDGLSRFGDVRELAVFLSSQLPSVRTVAWIPQSVHGYNVILALACHEIVMEPRANLGDIGRGKPVDPDAESFVLNLVKRRHNPLLSEALVKGMMDPQQEVLCVRVQVGDPARRVAETRIITPDEFQQLVAAKTVIEDQQAIKTPGADGVFSGEQARRLHFLAAHTAEARVDVCALYKLPREAMREDAHAGAAPRVQCVALRGRIDRMQAQFIERQIHRAMRANANVIVMEIDCDSGDLHQCTNLAYMVADLDPKQVRTVAYVPQEATGAAALVALGADEIYMSPRGLLGGAGAGEGNNNPGAPRVNNPADDVTKLKLTLRELAEKKRRPEALAMAMADRNLIVYEVKNSQTGDTWYMTDDEIQASNGVWIKGRALPEGDGQKLLTVSGDRAFELRLAEKPVVDQDELKTRLGLSADYDLRPIAPSWVDRLVYALNDDVVTGLLILLGIACIYLELHFTTGLFGILATVCFGLFFWSRFLGGTADWLEVMLFLIGIAFLAIEVFVTPGFGVFGVSGAMLIIGSLILASQTFVLPVSRADYEQLARSMGTLSGAFVGFIVVALLLARYLPSMPLFSHMVLVPPGATDPQHANEPRLRPELSSAGGNLLEQDPALVGSRGVAVTVLRPAGRAQIGDRLLDVVSDGPFIEQGSPVEVQDVIGNRIVVRQIT